MLIFAVGDPGFFIELLEKGGLPALTIGVLMTIFIFLWRSNAKVESARETSHQEALLAVAKERVEAREREARQYMELMKAYEEMVSLVVEISRESTRAVTRLSERVAYCPYRDPQTALIREDVNHG